MHVSQTTPFKMATTPNAYSITALQIANPDEFRKNVRSKLSERFTNSDCKMSPDAATNAALNLERGIYNYCVNRTQKTLSKNGKMAISCRFMPTDCAACASI